MCDDVCCSGRRILPIHKRSIKFRYHTFWQFSNSNRRCFAFHSFRLFLDTQSSACIFNFFSCISISNLNNSFCATNFSLRSASVSHCFSVTLLSAISSLPSISTFYSSIFEISSLSFIFCTSTVPLHWFASLMTVCSVSRCRLMVHAYLHSESCLFY